MAGWIETRPNGRRRARYPTPDGGTVSRTFDLVRDANEWLDEQNATTRSGAWVDPRQAKRPFGEWAIEWRAAQIQHRPSTAETTERRLRVHILPEFGRTPVGAITRTRVQAWVKAISVGRKPRTVEGIYNLLATIMRAAVDERLIAASPCRKINLPEIVDQPAEIPTVAQLEQIAGRLPASYRRIVAVIAGTGMRQGEARGLTVDRVDWLRRTVRVDRQLVTLRGGRHELGPPKRPASVRTIPVGHHTLDVLAAQVSDFSRGSDDTSPYNGLLFRSRTGRPLGRNILNEAWLRAARAAGCPEFTPHSGRDFYASLLIRQGLSVKAVAERLGHKDGGVEVLRTYAHLWDDDEDRTRTAVDAILMDQPRRQANG